MRPSLPARPASVRAGHRYFQASCLAAACLGLSQARSETLPAGNQATQAKPQATASRPPAVAAPSQPASAAAARRQKSPLPAVPPVPQPFSSRGRGPGRNNQYLFRFDEDYSYLREPSATAAPALPYKFIPLDDTRDSWLTLIGGERLYYDHNNLNVVPSPASSKNEFEARTTVGADMHFGPHYRFYVEGISGQYIGSTAIPGMTTADLGLYNAFVEIMDQAGGVQYGVRLGRQALWLANGLVICNRDRSNIPITWNGARAYADWGRGRVDVFDMVPTIYADNAFAGKLNTGLHLYGVYGSFALPATRLAGWPLNSSIDPFLIRYTSDNNSYQDGDMLMMERGSMPHFLPGADTRNTFGFRYYGGLGPIDFDYTGALQTGSTAGNRVKAWMFSTQTDYVWRNLASQPRLGMHFDGGSGGASGTPGHGQVSTYQPLYYLPIYYGDELVTSQTNEIDFAPRASINFSHNVSLEASWLFYYRQNQGDAIYNGGAAGYKSFNPYFRTAKIRGRYIGNMPDVVLHWRQNRYQIVTVTLSYFMPGSALRKIGGTSTFYAQVQSMMFF